MEHWSRRQFLAVAGGGWLAGRGVTLAPPVVAANPFASRRLYVDPMSQAATWVRANVRTRPEDAAIVRQIAEQPTAIWSGTWSDDPAPGVRSAIDRAAGALCVFVAYNIPHRDLGQYSAGGAPDADAYLKWFASWLSGVRGDRAALIFEPDALAHLDRLPAAEQPKRMEIFRRAMAMAARSPRLATYIDAGHPEWHPAGEMARRLRDAGVEHARGFSLNVSNFVETPRCLEYGREIAAALRSRGVAGKGFVVDTGRNGAGPFHGQPEGWCNPPGRALGDRPQVGPAPADALLWIKPPGESDGTCRQGPPAGRFWPEYAIALARGAH